MPKEMIVYPFECITHAVEALEYDILCSIFVQIEQYKSCEAVVTLHMETN